MTRRLGVALSVLALAATGTSCSNADPKRADSAPWRTSANPVDTSGLTWAAGSIVHLPDGTTIDTDAGFISTFVVAGDGVFFIPTDDEDEVGWGSFPADTELMFAAPGRPAIGTGLRISHDYLGASEDGRYLAVIETTAGKTDRFDTPQATIMAFDLQSGDQVVDSTLGMGDRGDDDFADLYSESEMQIWQVEDETLYVDATDDVVFDLTTGEGEEVADLPDLADDQARSPNGEWRIEGPDRGPKRIVGSDGSKVVPDTEGPRWNLFGWADEHTVVGTQITGPHAGNKVKPGDTVVLMTCRVPSGDCEVFEETAGERVVFSLGTPVGIGIVLRVPE